MRVLIVEDDRLWIDLIERNCTEVGTEFRTVTDSGSALTALEGEFYDGVLCDGVAGYQRVEEECQKRKVPFCLHSGTENEIKEGSYFVAKAQSGSREAVESFLRSPKDYGNSDEFMRFV